MKYYNDLSILIVLYDEKEEILIKSLELIKNFRIIILDNKNNIKLKKKLEKKFKFEKYILSKENIGYSKGYNKILSLCSTKYSFIKNPDCFIDEKNIIKLFNFLEVNANCGIVSPTSFDETGKYSFNSGLLPENETENTIIKNEGDICVEKVLGAAMFVRTNEIKKIGMFNEKFFLYFSDDDLCKKIKKLNKHIVQIYNSKCIHVHGISKVRNIIKKTFIREFYFTLDELIYFNKLNKTTYENIKSKILNYILKSILNLLMLRITKSVKYLSRIIAFLKFKSLKI